MSATDICFTAATDLAMRAKQLSPVEGVVAFLSRIDWLNPRINAYCLLLHDRARAVVLRASAAFEEAAPWVDKRPPLD
jgi:Asp-tRNA(Asn)/Glu-tRNA(Gln) amidotransferase A subunit family amidase